MNSGDDMSSNDFISSNVNSLLRDSGGDFYRFISHFGMQQNGPFTCYAWSKTLLNYNRLFCNGKIPSCIAQMLEL